ncbi:MAG: tripartite tricarboxylate transporter substrate binding protein [Spirochaetales bacterium]|nr:tripartite tricarboxylate transporter substrate binding protein [Spirochaetales bacterium]
MVNVKKISIVFLMILMLSMALFATAEKEVVVENYPEREIEAVITWGAGGLTDNIGRNFMPLLEERLGGSNIIIQNKAGASGAIGSQYIMNKPADGYSILITTTEAAGVWNVMGLSDMDVSDFQPIILVSSLTPTCYVKADAPWNSLEELIADAQSRPGKIIAGYAAPGSLGHVAGLLFSEYSDSEFNMVPFGGGGKVKAALLGGHVDVAFNPLISIMGDHEAGTIKLLATLSNEKLLDDAPALGQLQPQFQDVLPWGLMVMILVHKDTPESIVDTLTDAAMDALEDPRWKEFADKYYIQTMGQTGDDFWAKVDTWKSTTTWLLQDAGVAAKSPADFDIPRN